MATSENTDLGEQNWTNLKKKTPDQEVNEGFSGNNIADDYNSAHENIESRLRTETEKDEFGDKRDTERARFTDESTAAVASNHNESTDNSETQNKRSLENRDHNSDVTSNRYPESHPDNQQNRGNIKLDE